MREDETNFTERRLSSVTRLPRPFRKKLKGFAAAAPFRGEK
jgi:hypothetical protein